MVVMAKEDYAEDYGLFNPTPKKRSLVTRALQQSRYNPLMYLSLIFIVSLTQFVVAIQRWGFCVIEYTCDCMPLC